MQLPLIKTDALKEYICDFDRSGFTYEWQNNQQRQISFSLFRTIFNSDIFDLLQIGVSVLLGGQEYVIQQATPKNSGKVITKDIVATHIMYECQKRVYRYDTEGTDDNPVSLDPNDIMQWYFGGNSVGFTWEVKGSFEKQSMQGVGNGSGKDALDLIASKWACYIWADNKKIYICDADHFKTVTSKQLRYLYNTDEIRATIDRASLTNTCKCTGRQQTDDEGNAIGNYFDPFMYEDSESVAKWGTCFGAEVNDERFTDKASIETYAQAQLSPDPAVSLTLTYQGNDDVVEGEVWLLIAPLLGFDSDVTILGLQKYPYCTTKPIITLSNTLKDVYQIQREIAQQAKQARTSAGSALILANETAANQLSVEIVGDIS